MDIIRVSNVNKKYSNVIILNNINFTVKEGYH